VRLQKFLSAAGVASRRASERLIRGGHVKVNGEVVQEMGVIVDPEKDRVDVDHKRVDWTPSYVYVAVHKPPRMITSLEDPEGRPVITDLLPKGSPRMYPVGRLDWESDGLVLLTNDGTLTNLLTHPSSHVEKVYQVKLRGVLRFDDKGLEKMRHGLTLEDGFKTSGAQVSIEGTTGAHTWVQVILHEGHNRQIRRMAEAVGHTVLKLRRVSIGALTLGTLKAGHWRGLYVDEVQALYELTGGEPPRGLKPSDSLMPGRPAPAARRKGTKQRGGKRKR
jgi:23S rRNA pseudouridine2605 synthase